MNKADRWAGAPRGYAANGELPFLPTQPFPEGIQIGSIAADASTARHFDKKRTLGMKDSLRTGITFGLTSGVITTLGLMIGLHSGTHSRLVVIGGILTIAIADAFSDALGIHISEESENVHTTKQIWDSTIITFLSKFFFALTFVIPVIFLPLTLAIAVGLVWGLSILTLLSYLLAQARGNKPYRVIGEHLLIAVIVITITHFLGDWISSVFA